MEQETEKHKNEFIKLSSGVVIWLKKEEMADVAFHLMKSVHKETSATGLEMEDDEYKVTITLEKKWSKPA